MSRVCRKQRSSSTRCRITAFSTTSSNFTSSSTVCPNWYRKKLDQLLLQKLMIQRAAQRWRAMMWKKKCGYWKESNFSSRFQELCRNSDWNSLSDRMKQIILQESSMLLGKCRWDMNSPTLMLKETQMALRRGCSMPLFIISKQSRKSAVFLQRYRWFSKLSRLWDNSPSLISEKSMGMANSNSQFWYFMSVQVPQRQGRSFEREITAWNSVKPANYLTVCLLVISYTAFPRFLKRKANFSLSLSNQFCTCFMRMGLTAITISPSFTSSSSTSEQISSFYTTFSMICRHSRGKISSSMSLVKLTTRVATRSISQRALQLMATVVRSRRNSHMKSSVCSGFMMNSSRSRSSWQYLCRTCSYKPPCLLFSRYLSLCGSILRTVSADIRWSNTSISAPINAS